MKQINETNAEHEGFFRCHLCKTLVATQKRLKEDVDGETYEVCLNCALGVGKRIKDVIRNQKKIVDKFNGEKK